MENTPPPLLGFNNNVRHRGQVFHIQTEDSGVRHSRIMTHLFADGGRIVQTARTEYSEHVGRDDMASVVRRMMREQHKSMFVRLRAGELDAEIEQACGPLPLPPREKSTGGDDPAHSATVTTAAEAPVSRPERPLSNPNLRRVSQSVPPPEAGTLDFDVGSLADDAELKLRAATAASERATQPDGSTARDDARYAQSRPTAIFGDIPQPGSSIFGERNVSEKSLDEVILSYLAEDLGD